MELIKPSEISARILTLLDESDERVIIVSPYMNISKWYKFRNKLNALTARNIHLEIYVRGDPENGATYRDLDKLELPYHKIPHLHSKLYLNDRYGIVSSMNLLISSEINSLEIGYATETWGEYIDLLGFYHRYIQMGEPVHCDTIAGRPVADPKEIVKSITEELDRTAKNSWLWFAGNALHICTGMNNYIVTINDGKLRVTTSLRVASGTKQKISKRSSFIIKKIEDLTAMKIDIYPGPVPQILRLTGQAQQTLVSPCLTGILEAEAAYLIEFVRRFIDSAEQVVIREGLSSP